MKHCQTIKPTVLTLHRLMGGVVILLPTADPAVRVVVLLPARARLLLLSVQLLLEVMGDAEVYLMGLHATLLDLLADAARVMGKASILIKIQSRENSADQLPDIAAIHRGSKDPADDLNPSSLIKSFFLLVV